MRTNILQLAWRHAWRRLLQSLFFIVGIAIGVAAVVAIDLANSSVSRAFSYSTESIVGKTTHRIVGGSTGIDQKIYVDLRRKLGYQLCTPIISAYVTSKQLDQQPIQLLGIDIFSSLAFNTDSSNGLNSVDPVQLSRFMVQPNSAIISIQFASRHQLQINATIDVNFHGRSRRVTICQIIDGDDGNSSGDNILLVDISTAQEVHAKAGSISIHHARLVHGSSMNRSNDQRRILFFEFTAADAWPLLGIGNIEEFNGRIVQGQATIQPRLEDVPVRMPYPPAVFQGSIYENQRTLDNRFFASDKDEIAAS